ncbi:hypothetical protein GCM10017559_61260 [Streptosporangium longisporum]|uniref:Uncharacterized protein n=1 Tax=Streptosporangium longisporum TaxID=46187 RepID=A0ABP6KYN4_9ACTN
MGIRTGALVGIGSSRTWARDQPPWELVSRTVEFDPTAAETAPRPVVGGAKK